MDYALIKAGTVENVIVADADFVATIAGDWDHIEALDTLHEQGLNVGVGWCWDGAQFLPPPVAPEAEPEWAWYMDHGPFTDRLGPAATFAIDTSSEPAFVAIRADFARRKWIDMQDPRVAATVRFLAGDPLPGFPTLATPLLTAAKADEVLHTPVPLSANLALRRLYFS